MTLQSALKDTVEYLKDGMAPEKAIVLAAKDYGQNPVFLKRKFSEQYKVDVANYIEHQKGLEKVASNFDAKHVMDNITKAQKIARNEYAFYSHSAAGQRMNGKVFEYRGKKFVFVVNTSAGPVSVRVNDLQLIKWKRHMAAVICDLAMGSSL